MLHTHSLLIISASTETRYFAAVTILNTYVANDLNGLDAYTSYTLHEQDLVVVMYEKTNYMRATAPVLHSM